MARPPRMKSESGLSLDALTQFELEVSLGGAKLTREELLALAAAKEPLVRFRGRWVHVTAEEIRAALAVWRRKGGPLTARQVIAARARRALGARAPAPRRRRDLGLARGPAEAAEGPGAHGIAGAARRPSRAPCGRTRRAGSPGSPSSAAGASAPAWPTTWASARPCRRWRWSQHAARDRPRRPASCSSARRRWSATGSARRRASRPTCRVLVHHGGRRARGGDFKSQRGRARRRDLQLRAAAPRPRAPGRGRVGGRGPRRGAEHQEPGDPAGPGRARAARRLWRIALTGTPVENHVGDLWCHLRVPEPRPARRRRRSSSATFFVPIQARQRRERRRRASSGSRGRSSCAGSRPTRTSSPTCPTRWR